MSIPYWAMYYLYANGSNPPNCADPGGYREWRVWGA
jgi:hypothetical protein